MFDKLAPGAHSTVTGLVTLLAVAKNMESLKDEIETALKGKVEKNILFIIFNGVRKFYLNFCYKMDFTYSWLAVYCFLSVNNNY